MNCSPRGLEMTPAEFGRNTLKMEGKRWQTPPHILLMDEYATKLAMGEIDRLMVMEPPQTGKSCFWSLVFPTWCLGWFPEKRIILGSYNSTYAAEWGEKARNHMEEFGEEYFGLKVRPDHRSRDDWALVGHGGGMRTMGMDSGITGHPADIFLVDDPFKGPSDAFSEAQRDLVWNIFTSCVDSRIQPKGAICTIFTPWSVGDLGDRNLRNKAYDWKVLRMPALAEEPVPDEERAKKHGYDSLIGAPDPLGRRPGEALWPSRFGVEHYRRKMVLEPQVFDAIYQCQPHPKDGSVFKKSWFKGKVQPDSPRQMTRVRYWDRAASQAKGDWTVGLLMGHKDGVIWIEDIKRERLGPGPRDELIRETAESDKLAYGDVTIWGEEGPADSGKDASIAFLKNLMGFTAFTHRVADSKANRANPFASYCQGGNVYLKDGHWVEAFLDELVAFRDDGKSKHDDQVDAASGAFSKLALSTANRESTYYDPEHDALAEYGMEVTF